MRFVVKGTEPATVRDTRLASTTNLTTRNTAETAYGQCDKQQIRDALVGEQGFLCVFCMRGIEPAKREGREVTMKIAHRTPIAVEPELALTWTNLFGACDGGQRGVKEGRSCDTAQGSQPLRVDPTTRATLVGIGYEPRRPSRGLFITAEDVVLRAELGGC